MPVGPFTQDVVAAIIRHMNEDHADDTLLIVRALGNQPDADSATMTSVDAEGADFVGHVNGADVPVRLAWRERLTERQQVRREVVHLYREAERRSTE